MRLGFWLVVTNFGIMVMVLISTQQELCIDVCDMNFYEELS